MLNVLKSILNKLNETKRHQGRHLLSIVKDPDQQEIASNRKPLIPNFSLHLVITLCISKTLTMESAPSSCNLVV